MNLKRGFLIGLVVSLVLTALLGIVSLFPGQFWRLQQTVILTMMTTALFSLTALLAALVIEKQTWRPAMFVSLAISGMGLVLFLIVIWFHDAFGLLLPGWAEEALAKTMGLIVVWAIALPHAGLVSQVRLVGVVRYARLATVVLVLSLAATITGLVLLEADDDGVFIVVSAMAILTLLGTICIPILHKIQGIDKIASVESTSLRVHIKCPRCLTPQTVQTGHSRCQACRLRFQIEVEEPRCPSCNYLLHMLSSPNCPECGAALAPDELAPSQPDAKQAETTKFTNP